MTDKPRTDRWDAGSYLWNTAPYCGSGQCYPHWTRGRDIEHHVPPCPAAETVSSRLDSFSHAVADAMSAIKRANNRWSDGNVR